MQKMKSDWPEARQRLIDWWAGKRTDRVVALVTTPIVNIPPKSRCDTVPDMYTDAETVFSNLDATLSTTYYGGEAAPMHWVYLGTVPLGGYLGCPLHFTPSTVWQDQLYRSWDEVTEITFDPANRWYRLLGNLTRQSLLRAQGRYFVSGQGFGCVSDVIANLWGTEATLLAMVETPEIIDRFTRQITEISLACYDEIHALAAPYQEGSFDWLYLWAPGRMWTLQSDLCCMISPALFERFVLPELRREAEHVDHAFYHLDGPGAIRHLDMLLSIEALDGIQWVPGAGNSQDPLDWLQLFHRIQAAGKKLYIFTPPDRIRPLLDRIGREGVCLYTWAADRTEANAVLKTLDEIGM